MSICGPWLQIQTAVDLLQLRSDITYPCGRGLVEMHWFKTWWTPDACNGANMIQRQRLVIVVHHVRDSRRDVLFSLSAQFVLMGER